jgi:hypothetical protein
MAHNGNLIPRMHVYVAGLHNTSNVPENVEYKAQSDCYSPEFRYSLIGYANQPFTTTDGREAQRQRRDELTGSPFLPVSKMIRIAEAVGYRLGSLIGKLRV